MKTLILTTLALSVAAGPDPAAAPDPSAAVRSEMALAPTIALREGDFADEPAAQWLVPDAEPSPVLRITADEPTTIRLATIDEPPVAGLMYAVEGWIEYDGVQPDAHLEMWSVFPDGSRYFTRALADGGLLGRISGTAARRDFQLPFNAVDGGVRPSRLEINLVIPGKGRIDVGTTMHLVAMDPAAFHGEPAVTYVRSVPGNLFVLLALLAAPVSLLGFGLLLAFVIAVAMGRMRAAMICACIGGGVLIAVGLVMLPIAGTFAGLVLIGIGLVIVVLATRKIRRGEAASLADEQAEELRRMRAMDV